MRERGILLIVTKKLVELLERYHENIVVRQHPRDKSADYSVFYAGYSRKFMGVGML